MSIVINKLTLTPQQKDLIKKETYITKETSPFNAFIIENENVKLPLHFALTKILTKKQKQDFYNKDYPKVNFEFEGELREKQEEWCKSTIKILNEENGCIVGLYPGAGKTVIGAWLISKISFISVVMVHREILVSQWNKTFSSHLPNSKVWSVNGKAPLEIPDIIICMADRVSKIPKEWLPQIGTMIIDEAHTFCTQKKVPGLLSFTPHYVIAETATLERPDSSHKFIELITSPNGIFVKSNAKVPYKVFSVNVNTFVEEEKNDDGTLNYNKYMKALSECDKMNDKVIEILKQFPKKKFIVLTKLVEHANYLKQLVELQGFNVDILCGTKKTYVDADVLIGTISKIGTGFDQSSACQNFTGKHCDSLIFFHTVARDSLFHQNIGRVMRSDHETFIFWLTPKNKIASRHLNNLKLYIKETNGTVEKIN